MANMTRRAARDTHELLRVTNMTTTARRARAIPVLRCAFSCSFWAARCVIIPGCVPFNYLPEWQHLAHTKVPEPVRRLTSRVTSANSCRRFTPVASLPAACPPTRRIPVSLPCTSRGTLLYFSLFFLCLAPNCKVDQMHFTVLSLVFLGRGFKL